MEAETGNQKRRQMHCLGKQRLNQGGQSLSGVEIEHGCERQEETLLQVHHQQKTDWRKCNSAVESGSNLVMKGTEKVEVPNTLGMVFYQQAVLSGFPGFCI